MFSKSIVLSDNFLDMPASSRCLYFTLGMLADDDGFVNSPKSIMRQCGATEDDMKILIAKYFLIPFESGVVVIRQWRINNYLRSDRYTETKCIEEKSQLYIEKDGSYSVMGKQPRTSRIKNNVQIPLLNRDPKNDLERIEKIYLQNYKVLYERGVLRLESPVINWTACRKLENDCLKKYGVEVLCEAVKKSIENQFVVSKGYVLTTILSAGVLAQLINSTDGRIDNDSFMLEEVEF